MKKILALLLAMMMALSLCACGGGVKGRVPDSYISMYLNEEGFNESGFSTKHNYNSDTHIDTVVVTLTKEGYYGTATHSIELMYQYSKNTDLWSLIDEDKTYGQWAYNFNKNLIGEWSDEYIYSNFVVKITDVDSTSVTAGCYANIETWGYGAISVYLDQLDQEQTYELEGSQFYVKMQLPDGYYAYHSGKYDNYTEICVYLDIDKGVDLISTDADEIGKY